MREKQRIGVLMMLPPGPAPSYSYIRTSVLKWFSKNPEIEVVVIPATVSGSEIAAYFEYIHGLYLHPDWAEHPAYAEVVRTFLTMATLANRSGDYFPVWGTCLGYESLMDFFGHLQPFEQFDARRLEKALSKMNLRTVESRLLSYAAAVNQLTHLRHTYVPYFDHDYGVSVVRFNRNASLRKTFRILSTCHDRAGKEYISMVEGKSLPFYGTQFHPDMDASMTWMADFFLQEAQKSKHTGFCPASANPALSPGFCLEEMKYKIPCMRT